MLTAKSIKLNCELSLCALSVSILNACYCNFWTY